MPIVLYNNEVLAEHEDPISYDCSWYFPPHTLSKIYFTESKTKIFDPAIGLASYYDIEVHGRKVKDAAWYYPDPKPWAAHIKDQVAFLKTRITIMG